MAYANVYTESSPPIKRSQTANGLSLAFADRASAIEYARTARRAHPEIHRIIEAVAEATGFAFHEIAAPGKGPRELSLARDLVAYEAHLMGFKDELIGRAMNRDRTSIVDARLREAARRAS